MLATAPISALAVGALFAVGCGAQPTDASHTDLERVLVPQGKSRVPVGGRGQSSYYEMRASVPDECSPRQADALPKAFARLGVEVTLSALSQVQVPANPYYATLIDEDGRVYEATLGGCEPALPPRLLVRGESARGWLAFDVPENVRGLSLSYAPRLSLAPEQHDPRDPPSDVIDELVFALGR